MEPSLFKVHSLKRMTQPGAKFCLPVYLCPWYSPRWVLLSRWMSKAGSHKCDGGPSAMSQESDHSTIPRSKCNVFSLLLRCADVITSYYIICCRARLNFSAASVLLQCSQAAVFPIFAFRRCSAFGERRCSDWCCATWCATCCAIPYAFPDRHFTVTHVWLWSIFEAEGRTVYFGPPSSAKVCALECCCVGFFALLQAWSQVLSAFASQLITHTARFMFRRNPKGAVWQCGVFVCIYWFRICLSCDFLFSLCRESQSVAYKLTGLRPRFWDATSRKSSWLVHGFGFWRGSEYRDWVNACMDFYKQLHFAAFFVLVAVTAVAGAKSQNSTVCARDAVRHLGGAVLKFLISNPKLACTAACIWHTLARLETYTSWQLNKDRIESKSRVSHPA